MEKIFDEEKISTPTGNARDGGANGETNGNERREERKVTEFCEKSQVNSRQMP